MEIGFNRDRENRESSQRFEALSYVECERIIAIVEDATEKLGFLDR